MMTSDNATERVLRQLKRGNVGLAMAEMEVFLAAWPQVQTAQRLKDLKAEYELMTGYWRQGMDDPQQQEQYLRLLQRMYVLYANVAVTRRVRASSFLKGLSDGVRSQGRDWSVTAIRNELENFVSEVALLELEPEHRRADKSQTLYKNHQRQMNDLFNYVLTSRMWSEGVGRDFTDMLLSPTVDSADQQLITSAVMLSLMSQFDMVKFRVLTDVYRDSQDEYVRQRALVGWVFALDCECLKIYPEEQTIVNGLLESDTVCKELKELQLQLIYTLEAERDTTTIQKEIMPDLLKNQPFRITRNGIEEVEDDPLEDILHPDAAEQRMEKLESTFQRMVDMQRRGADIYFGGFSQMKRFPFFYDLSNWLVPFYMQHPDIAQYVQKMGDSGRFASQFLSKGPFCNSDKYSFVMVFQQVVDKLPESLRQMLQRGEADTDMPEPADRQSAAYIRRIYLMDLYRLFRLFPNRAALRNPFAEVEHDVADWFFYCSPLFVGTPLDASKHEMVRVLQKHHYSSEALTLLDFFPEEIHDVQYFIWRGDYAAALELEPDNERALAGRARLSFDEGRYEDADDDYERLLLLHPGKMGYMLNKAVCLVNMEEYDDALKLLYQLNYEHADDLNIQRVLAWTLTCANKLEQAERIYQSLTEEGQTVGEDFQNYGYCLWLQGRIDDAATMFRQYMAQTADARRLYTTLFDEQWLLERGVTETQVRMMHALVVGNDVQTEAADELPF